MADDKKPKKDEVRGERFYEDDPADQFTIVKPKKDDEEDKKKKDSK